MKKLGLVGLLAIVMPLMSYAQGQSIQISTHFRSIIGNPTWLLEVRDMNSGQVTPYLFDFSDSENFWVAFSNDRAYRIVASNLKFGPYAKINNFCCLENGIISGKSMSIIISGELSPDPSRIKCKVFKYPGNLTTPFRQSYSH